MPSTGPTSATSLRGKLARIDAKIAELQARVLALTSQRISTVEALKSITYPILTIPVEITARIFSHYCEPIPPISDWHATQGPLLLAAVCRVWRNIALNDPSIWSQLRIIVHEGDPTGPVLQRLRRWLPRAGTRPLNLDIQRCYEHPDEIFREIAAYSTRWKTFAANLTAALCFNEVRGRFPLLRTLNLSSSVLPEVTIAAFSEAPMLRVVHLTEQSASSISLPWSQLTVLTCERHDASQCADILRRVPRLEVLTLKGIDCASPSPSPIRLDNLHTLIVGPDFSPEDSSDCFLDSLTVPVLKHFKQAYYLSGNFDTDCNHLEALLQRSKCTLISLSLVGATWKNVLHISDTTDTISELYLSQFRPENPPESQEWLLDSIAEEPMLLRHLKIFHIQGCIPNGIPYPEIARLLCARGPGSGSALREFRFEGIPQDDDGAHYSSKRREQFPAAREHIRDIAARPGALKVSISAHRSFSFSTDLATNSPSYTLADPTD